MCLAGNAQHIGIMASQLEAPRGMSAGFGVDLSVADACDPRQLQGPFDTKGGNVGPLSGGWYGSGSTTNGVSGGLSFGLPLGAYHGTNSSKYFGS